MPTIPDEFSLGRRPTPQPLTGVPTIQTRTGSETAIGEAQARAGSAITEIGVREGLRLDEARAEDAINQAKLRAIELENEYQNEKGEAVLSEDYQSTRTKKYEDSLSEIEKKLGNSRQRELFRSRIAPTVLGYKAGLGDHVQRQTDEYHKATAEATIDLSREEAARNFNNPSAIAATVARTSNIIDAQAERNGWSDKVTKAAKQAAISDIHTSVIASAVTNDPAYAEAYYKANKKEINAKQREKIENEIEDNTIRAKAQDATDMLISKGMSEAQTLKEVREQYDGKLEDEIVARIKGRFNEQKLRQNEAVNEAWLQIGQGVQYSELPSELKSQIPGNVRASMQDTARKLLAGEKPVQDWKAWTELNDLIVKANLGDKKAKKEIQEMDVYGRYRMSLDDVHFDQAIRAKNAFLLSDEKKKQEILQSSKAVTSDKAAMETVVNRILHGSSGSLKKKPKRTQKDEEFAVAFEALFMTEMEQYRIQNETKSVPFDVRTQILKNLAKTFTQKDGGWAYLDKEWDLNDIPPAEMTRISNELRALGIPVTGEAILSVYVDEQK